MTNSQLLRDCNPCTYVVNSEIISLKYFHKILSKINSSSVKILDNIVILFYGFTRRLKGTVIIIIYEFQVKLETTDKYLEERICIRAKENRDKKT